MLNFFIILKDIILPIFLLIGTGFVLQRKLSLDIRTLTRLNIYILVPCFVFIKLYEAEFTFSFFLKILSFFVLYILIMFFISHFISLLFHFDKGKRTIFKNSTIFFNSGNYGVPVNDLTFNGDPFAMSIQVIILTLQNIIVFSYGIFSMGLVHNGKLKGILGYFKIPIIYAMVIGLLLNIFKIEVPFFLFKPINYIAEALIAIALITLGIQVGKMKLSFNIIDICLSLSIRLFVGPIVAILMIRFFHITGMTAQALLIASAMPTSVNNAVIALEYNNNPEYASQIVIYSTIFSSITVSAVIFYSKVFL